MKIDGKFLALLIFDLVICAPALAQPSIIDQIQKSQGSIVSIRATNTDVFQTAPAIVGRDPSGRILMARKVVSPSYNRGGAGVIIDQSGIIITNSHTVHKANNITIILSDNSEHPAEVLKVINDLDLAFLKIKPPYPLKAVPMADSDRVQLRDEIITVGNSSLLKQTISGGKVIGLGVSTNQIGKETETKLIQTSINLYEGDSGGPLFDHRGSLIGLMTAKEMGADHSSFAVPSNKIKYYLEELTKP